MKATHILFIIVLVVLLITIRLRMIWKKATEAVPDDEIYQLRWKIENCEINDYSEKYLIHQLRELRKKEGIDYNKLKELENIFQEKFYLKGDNKLNPKISYL